MTPKRIVRILLFSLLFVVAWNSLQLIPSLIAGSISFSKLVPFLIFLVILIVAFVNLLKWTYSSD